MNAFAGLKKEVWCSDLSCVHEPAKVDNGVMFSLARQELFNRTAASKRKNQTTKRSQ